MRSRTATAQVESEAALYALGALPAGDAEKFSALNVCSALSARAAQLSNGGSRPIECATRRFKRLSCGDWK